MTYRGTVSEGVIVLGGGVRLPEGAAVSVQLLSPTRSAAPKAGAQPEAKNGIPLFPRSESDQQPDLDLVNQLRERAV